MVKKAAVSVFFLLTISGGVFLALAFYVMDVVSPLRQAASLLSDDEISSQAWAVFDPETGEILLAKNENDSLPVASVTKLFLANEILKEENVFATTTITWSDLAAYGSAGRLVYGDVYDFYTLLFPLLLSSSNDAAAVLVRNFSGIVEQINNKSGELSLSAHFSDGSGLSAENIASAKALAVLSSNVWNESPQVLAITKLPYHARNEGGWQNNNPVFTEPGYMGGKSGYTDQANHTLVVFFAEDTVLGGSKNIGYVLLGSNDLESDIKKLRKHATSKLWWYSLAAK